MRSRLLAVSDWTGGENEYATDKLRLSTAMIEMVPSADIHIQQFPSRPAVSFSRHTTSESGSRNKIHLASNCKDL